MTKNVRIVKRLAEQEGLRVVRVECGTRHWHIVVENQQGVQIVQPMSLGTNGDAPRLMSNMRSHFRRLAKGQTHGLRVTSGSNDA